MAESRQVFREVRGYKVYANAKAQAVKLIEKTESKFPTINYTIIANEEGRFIPLIFIRQEEAYLVHTFINKNCAVRLG